MTAHPPNEPRLTMLAGRLARLRDLETEAAYVTAGIVAIAAELGLLPRSMSDDSPALTISSAYWATSQSVATLIAAGVGLLDEINNERLRQAHAHARARQDPHDPPWHGTPNPAALEQPATVEGHR